MSHNRSYPRWWKKLLELGNPKPLHSDSKRSAYRTVTYRYFWGLAGLFVYFLLCAYLLGGDGSGSSDNSGILILIFGAFLVGGLAAFFAPRLNETIEKLLPSGRRKKEETIQRQPHGSRSKSSSSRGRSRSCSSSARSQSEKVDP